MYLFIVLLCVCSVISRFVICVVVVLLLNRMLKVFFVWVWVSGLLVVVLINGLSVLFMLVFLFW